MLVFFFINYPVSKFTNIILQEISFMAINISTKFDAGSIEIIDASQPENIILKIRKDTNSHFAQWFYFQVNGVKDTQTVFNFIEMDKTAYPEGWLDYRVCVSYDNSSWFRTPTTFDGKTLTCGFTPTANTVYLAYFEPYSYDRHLRLIGQTSESSIISHQILGQTHQGRNIDLLVVGNPQSQNKTWIIARQHPGETMAEWFMEGLISNFLNCDDAVVNKLLEDCVFYLVPNMNPDGAYLGNLRVNSVGANLNREWGAPSLEKSPEVYQVQNKMLDTGVDMFFDIHGDEAIPYVFTSGCEDNPSWSEKQKKLNDKFIKYLKITNPDYQTTYGYERGHFSAETATLATSWVGDKFDCLALTLEMPFKDNKNFPDKFYGWNGKRSSMFGKTFLTAISLVLYD
jgi:murein tripeptide amidase MpaA